MDLRPAAQTLLGQDMTQMIIGTQAASQSWVICSAPLHAWRLVDARGLVNNVTQNEVIPEIWELDANIWGWFQGDEAGNTGVLRSIFVQKGSTFISFSLVITATSMGLMTELWERGRAEDHAHPTWC